MMLLKIGVSGGKKIEEDSIENDSLQDVIENNSQRHLVLRLAIPCRGARGLGLCAYIASLPAAFLRCGIGMRKRRGGFE